MAKRIEVFESEYEYLKKFHEEATLELTTLTAERDRLRQDYDELMKDFARLAYYGDCFGCKHANEFENACIEANGECVHCKADCLCKECIQGSNYEYSKSKKENEK